MRLFAEQLHGDQPRVVAETMAGDRGFGHGVEQDVSLQAISDVDRVNAVASDVDLRQRQVFIDLLF